MTRPVRYPELCSGCDRCREICKADAIAADHELILEHCVSCGSCVSECETGALQWPAGMSASLQNRLAEVAYAVLKNLPHSKCLFVNSLSAITPFCDCGEFAPEHICPDIGILASHDSVAVDQATVALIGTNAFEGDPIIQMREAHALGLGELNYELIRV